MNFYLLESDQASIALLRDLIENDFDNTLVGLTADPNRAYEELLQLRVDIMIVSYQVPGMSGVEMIHRLQQVNNRPHFIMIGPSTSPVVKEEAYRAGCDFYLPLPLNRTETRSIIRQVATHVRLLNRVNQIYEIASSSIAPYNRPQSTQRRQMDHVDEVLRFLGIAAETGSKDIRKIIRVMIDQKITFSSLDYQRDFHISDHEKKITFQRIRRALRVGITNLATMCMDYPENDILLEYANNLFEYQNIHIEIQRLRNNEDVRRGQVSIQHFFDGLLQESSRGLNSVN